MAIVVETGTGTNASANSYIALAFADSFCSDLGLSEWASAATADRESAILRGMSYIDALDFRGVKYDYDDPLEWPRSSVVDDDGYAIDEDEIPTKLQKATARAAYEELISPGVLQSVIDAGIKRERIDVIEVEYFQSSSTAVKINRAIEGYLKGLLETGSMSGGQVELFRV